MCVRGNILLSRGGEEVNGEGGAWLRGGGERGKVEEGMGRSNNLSG